MTGRNRKASNPTLKAWRVSLDLTQHEAAALLGVSAGYYAHLELHDKFAGKKLGKEISQLTAVPLEQVLGIA